MKQEVVDFYKAHKIPVHRMVQVGVRRRGLTADSIKSSAEQVYEEIKSGTLAIKPIQIAWEVYGRSNSGATPTSTAAVYDAIINLEKKWDEHMTPWYVKFWRKINGDKQDS